MVDFISIVHALTCIFIVVFILLQDPKGGVLGSLGGGAGGKAFFGSEGASPFLVQCTKWLAIAFACSSFYLSYVSSQKDNSLMAPNVTPINSTLPSNPNLPAKTPTKKSDNSKKTK